MERYGSPTIYVRAFDDWGNIADTHIPGTVIPGALFAAFLLPLFWLALLLLLVLLAPINTFCHDLLMNPWLRNYGSFGVIPLLLANLPPLRRHVLSRYRRNLCNERDFAEWRGRFVLPSEDFHPKNFGKEMAAERKLLLIGQSGTGKTSFLKYLTLCYASRNTSGLLPTDVVPVFLPLARYQGVDVKVCFDSQLSNYGRITDEKLTSWFLQQGGFFIMADGLNEVDEATRGEMNTFVDQYWKSNYFALSSQLAYPVFASWIKEVKIAELSPQKIREYLEHELGKEMAGSVINQFDETTYELYRIAQDLEFAIRILREGRPLPKSRLELYESTLAPIFDEWNRDGQTDYPDLLLGRAYEMQCARDPFFDKQNSHLPDALRDRLVEMKYLIRRDNHYQFGHDLIRAYLSSKYFYTQWSFLLAEDTTKVDINWKPMLEFVFLQISAIEDAKDLMFALLRRNTRLAGDLFKWIGVRRPELTNNWGPDFEQSYGKARLEES